MIPPTAYVFTNVQSGDIEITFDEDAFNREIWHRQEVQLSGDHFRGATKMVPAPRQLHPLTHASLAASLAAEKQLLVAALEVVASGNTDPDTMVELARATLAKTTGETP